MLDSCSGLRASKLWQTCCTLPSSPGSTEVDGGMSFRGFVDALQTEASAGRAAEAPILEEGSEGVRLMTVHKAKGLEFPVVILADITARLTPHEASRHIDNDGRLCALRIGGWSPKDLNDSRDLELGRERREGERVAYVAATRARDLLVIPGVGDGPYTEGWVSPLNAVIYPPEQARRIQAVAEGCPAFKSKDSVLNRPDGDPATSRTVCPGKHLFDATGEGHTVVWWSPEPDVLALDAQAPLGLRRDDLIVKDVSAVVLRERLDAYTSWRQSRDAAITEAGIPSIRVMTATEASIAGDASPLEDVEVAIDTAARTEDRPGGGRFGTLVHELLADIPLASGPDGKASTGPAVVSRLAAAHGRILGADASEVEAAQAVVSRVLAHPLVRAAARAVEEGRCHRETPVTYRCEDGSLVEGTVDLAYEDANGFVVIDFKTDRPDDVLMRQYRRQVAWYAAAIARATGRSARAVLMMV